MTKILCGDVIQKLRELADGSVHCVVTSPPYYGLRDYKTGSWKGGDPACDHAVRKPGMVASSTLGGGKASTNHAQEGFAAFCGKCGAIRVDKQIGLEPTPEEFVAKLVEVFREVKRVLRDDGSLWLNLGDSYAGSWGNYGGQNRGKGKQREITNGSQVPNPAYDGQEKVRPATSILSGDLKPKDLIGIPWAVAFALRADGWYLRSAVTICKKNPMPESVLDRPTSATEMMFLLTKKPKYFYDAFAVRTANKDPKDTIRRLYEDHSNQGKTEPTAMKNGLRQRDKQRGHSRRRAGFNDRWDAMEKAEQQAQGANLRNWWPVATEPFKEAHFATFGVKWITPCIKAGTSEYGVCPKCGAPWKRIVSTRRSFESGSGKAGHIPVGKNGQRLQGGGETLDIRRGPTLHQSTDGWQPTCSCEGNEPIPATVLDPFSGAATTGIACLRLGRDYLGIELNPDYVEMSELRLERERLLHPRAERHPRVELPNQERLFG